jgi:hypothetical protein
MMQEGMPPLVRPRACGPAGGRSPPNRGFAAQGGTRPAEAGQTPILWVARWTMAPLLDRYADRIRGVLSCYDRVVIQGTLPGICYPAGMASYLTAHGIRLFDYPRFAEPLRDEIRANAERLAAEHGIEIEFVRRPDAFRKEDRIRQVLAQRGEHPGLVHVLSAMEACPTYRPWHDKTTHKTSLKPDRGKCLHYYFYFLDEELGLGYVRVPTWCPFRLQVYFNGHNVLAAKLRRRHISYKLVDNAFVEIDDWNAAQKLSDQLDVAKLHRALDRLAKIYCPVFRHFGVDYHWSLMQVEYATDVVFKSRHDLADLYEVLSRTAIHAVKPDHVATFLGRKLDGRYQAELGTDFGTRIEGTRIKHYMGPASIKMYDKFGLVLRIETTANDVTFFKHHRTVEHRDGERNFKLAPLRKTIYSLDPDLRELLVAANRRYLAFISDLDDPTVGMRNLQKLAQPVEHNGKTYKGFNFFADFDLTALLAITRGETTIAGIRNRDIRQRIPGSTTSRVSHLLKRLRLHGLLKQVGRTYKYYLTELGRRAVLTGLKLKELVLIPALAQTATS